MLLSYIQIVKQQYLLKFPRIYWRQFILKPLNTTYIKSFLFCFRLVENINLSFAQYKSTQCELDDFPSPERRPVYFWILDDVIVFHTIS